MLGIDLNNDGDKGDEAFTYATHSNDTAVPNLTTDGFDASTATYGTSPGKIKESDIRYKVAIKRGFFKIKKDPLTATKGLKAARTMLREDEGEQTIELTVTLNAAAAKNEEVKFTISEVQDPDDTSRKLGERDRDYIVSVEELTILKGEKEGTADLTVIPDNNPGSTGNRKFKISATVGGATSATDITIIDIDTFSTEITLTADPAEIKEDADADSVGVPVKITATLNGQVFDEDKTLTLALRISGDGKGTATRDVDYTARI